MSDDRLKQKLEHLAKKVHEELVEIERAIAPSAALQLSGDQAVPSARQRRREGATPLPQGETPAGPFQEAETPRRHCADPKCWTDCKNLFWAHETESGDRALDYLAAVRLDGSG